MLDTPNEKFLIEFNAVKLLTMALTKVILENSPDADKSASQIIGMINAHMRTQKVEGLDVRETEALRKAVVEKVEQLVNSVKVRPTYLRS
jgi:hypothetical protein